MNWIVICSITVTYFLVLSWMDKNTRNFGVNGWNLKVLWLNLILVMDDWADNWADDWQKLRVKMVYKHRCEMKNGAFHLSVTHSACVLLSMENWWIMWIILELPAVVSLIKLKCCKIILMMPFYCHDYPWCSCFLVHLMFLIVPCRWSRRTSWCVWPREPWSHVEKVLWHRLVLHKVWMSETLLSRCWTLNTNTELRNPFFNLVCKW